MGQAWWVGDCGPFWGHNALVRIKPFHEQCDLPMLPGKPPLGGHVLSHDQVEATLMRRAGYEVRVLPVERGSWEENPPTMLEFARRAETADVLLQDAVDSISDGFAIYDREDCFVMCNEAYRRIHHRGPELMVPGARFEDLLRVNVAEGRYPDATGREEVWIAQRLRAHQKFEGTLEHQLSDGRWLLVRDRGMRNGGIICLRIDITELKTVQAALQRSEERLNRAQRLAAIPRTGRRAPQGRRDDGFLRELQADPSASERSLFQHRTLGSRKPLERKQRRQ